MTNGFRGLHNGLTGDGIEIHLGVTSIYQQNVHGGISQHRRAGRLTASYDLELSADLQKLLGIEGGSLYMLTEGSFSEGIDGPSVGSFFGVNGDARCDRSMDITELWYEQTFADETIRLRLGKIDLTGGFEQHGYPVSFDCVGYANDETSQFLNNALVNNPTIPFPEYGLAAIIHYAATDLWYVSAGAADAQADVREPGFRTAFNREDYFFYILETGATPQLESVNGPLQGAYRAGLWNDPQPKAHADAAENYRDDVGFYLSCDQMLAKENTEPQDSQGLGAFFRYGYADSKRNDMTHFWSGGFQYQGLVEGRDEDVLGAGFAYGVFSDMVSSTYPEDHESVLELYYNAEISPRLDISPSIQYITNPGGAEGLSDTVVLAIRLQMLF